MSTNETPTGDTHDDLVARLEAADQRVADAHDEVEEFGEQELRDLQSLYDSFTDVLDRYEEQVTDDGGDYETNIEFQSAVADVLNGVSEDTLLYETFEECDEALKQRWFSEEEFREVREMLEPVADLVGRVEELDDATSEYRTCRRDIEHEIRSLDAEIDELDRLVRLGNADLDAPTERLREPIEAYNEAVEAAFQEFRREASVREVLAFVEATEAYPLVPFEQPGDQLEEYVDSYPPGEETIETLLEYADYSDSKLDHYVDDPRTLKEAVAGRQTYLMGLDAEPLTIGWPPPEAEELRFRCQELTSAVNRFAPDVVEHLRGVAALPRETDYERLRNSVLARESLTDEQRERIKSEDIQAQLDAARERRERLQTALDEYPSR